MFPVTAQLYVFNIYLYGLMMEDVSNFYTCCELCTSKGNPPHQQVKGNCMGVENI